MEQGSAVSVLAQRAMKGKVNYQEGTPQQLRQLLCVAPALYLEFLNAVSCTQYLLGLYAPSNLVYTILVCPSGIVWVPLQNACTSFLEHCATRGTARSSVRNKPAGPRPPVLEHNRGSAYRGGRETNEEHAADSTITFASSLYRNACRWRNSTHSENNME